MKSGSRILLILITLTSVFFIHSEVSAQSDREKKLLKTAEKLYEEGELQEASKYFLQLISISPENFEYNYKTAICYLNSPSEKAKSMEYFAKASKKTKDTLPDTYYYLGMAYQFNNKFDEAISSFQKFSEMTKGKSIGKKLTTDVNRRIQQCKYGNWLVNNPQKVLISNIGRNINSNADDYASVLSSDESKLIFTSKRKGQVGGLFDEYGDPYEDIFYSTRDPSQKSKQGNMNAKDIPAFTVAKRLGKQINTQFHDAAIALATNGSKLFIYQNQNLFVSYTDGKKWEKPVKIPTGINKRDDQPGMCISEDEKTIFFVSDRKGGFGGKDIYKIEKKDDGTWSSPENLGSKINSKFNEEGPTISPDGNTLYFSSEGHDGMGGYDLFKSEIKYGKWEKAQNLGYPLNTSFDELYFVPNGDLSHAYFSSSRDGGFGNMDIYYVNITEMSPTPSNDTLPEIKKSTSEIEKSKPSTFIAGTPKKAEIVVTLPPPPAAIKPEKQKSLPTAIIPKQIEKEKEKTTAVIPTKTEVKAETGQPLIKPKPKDSNIEVAEEKKAVIQAPKPKSAPEIPIETIVTTKAEAKTTIAAQENKETIKKPLAKFSLPNEEPGKLYFVQFAASLNPIAPEKIQEENVKYYKGQNGYLKYLVGGFADSLNAVALKKELLEKGYNGPFVVSANPALLSNLNEKVREEKKSNIVTTQLSKSEEPKEKPKREITELQKKQEEAPKKETPLSQQLKGIETTYSVLIGSYRRGIPVDLIDAYLSIKDVFVENRDSLTIYFTGIFDKKEDAQIRKKEVNSKGFKEASIVTSSKPTSSSTLPPPPSPTNTSAPPSASSGENTVATKIGRNIYFSNTPTTNTPSLQTPELVINAPIKKTKPNTPPKIVYKVQIGAFRDNVPTDIMNLFITLSDVEKENAGNPITVYTCGHFNTYPEAEAHRNELLKKGIANPFVVPYNNGVRITVPEALELSK